MNALLLSVARLSKRDPIYPKIVQGMDLKREIPYVNLFGSEYNCSYCVLANETAETGPQLSIIINKKQEIKLKNKA